MVGILIPKMVPKMRRCLEAILKAVRHEKPGSLERAIEILGLVEMIAEEGVACKEGK